MSQATTLTGTRRIKALSLRQPYATLIAHGLTKHRFVEFAREDYLSYVDAIINQPDDEAIIKKTIETRTWQTKYRGPLLICASLKPKIEGLPCGVAVALSELVACRPMTKDDEEAACCELYDDAQAWILTNIRPIKPFPVKGQLSIFNIDVPEMAISKTFSFFGFQT